MIDFSWLHFGFSTGFVKRYLQANAHNVPCAIISERLRKAICEFQLEYTNYHFTSSLAHMDFKESYGTENENQNYVRMSQCLESGFKVVEGKIASQVQNYFVKTRKSSIPPRVGIHLITQDDDVVDIVMLESSKNPQSSPKKITDYTAIEEVISTGRPYLENNIPSRIKNNNNYKHKGISRGKVIEHYNQPLSDLKFITRRNANDSKIDEEWASMASGLKTNEEIRSLYKSHAVVPITFRRHAEKNMLQDQVVDVLNLKDCGRSILGLLFVDHPHTYYFDDKEPNCFDNTDINALVVFADIISLVMITKLMYTQGSRTCSDFQTK